MGGCCCVAGWLSPARCVSFPDYFRSGRSGLVLAFEDVRRGELLFLRSSMFGGRGVLPFLDDIGGVFSNEHTRTPRFVALARINSSPGVVGTA